MTLRQRILLVLSSIVLLLVVLSGGAWVALALRDQAIARIDEELEPARDALLNARAALVDQSTASRSYLLTRDRRYVLLHREAGEQLEAAFAELRTRVGTDPALRPLLAETREAAYRWQAQAGEREMALGRAGRAEEAIAITKSGRGLALFDQFRDKSELLRAALVTAEAQARERSTTARSWLATLIIASVVTAVALVTITAILLRRWITTPLQQIMLGADSVVSGNLHRPITVTGPPEVAYLGATVERMRARIVGSLAEATTARQALEQEGPAVVMLREELRPEGDALPPEIALEAAFQPARGILAGDWYDWVVGDDGRVAVMVVDVAGHGEAAGAYALRSKHLLLAALRDGHPPDRAVEWLSSHMRGEPESFLTAALVVIDFRAGRCTYVNAGHPSPFVVVHDRIHHLPPTGPLVGALPGDWIAVEAPFPAGGTLVLYTDGVTEARGANGEFGEERLVEAALRYAATRPDAFVRSCLHEVVSFAGGPPDDDATIVAVRCDKSTRR